MALTPGTRLGAYEITAQIGVGGMGEVYRATDTKLRREVAIKVIPGELASDAERLARFQREAEVLASLNHPNIAAIYGLEDADGSKALVMELVEGQTLAERIAQGPIPAVEALLVARQVAEALEAAHERGIVHRDLKPANVKVRPDGVVKVLDFGLAKPVEPAAGVASHLSMAPTIATPPVTTMQGMIQGTPAYMSPEQARGKPVDRRTDVWAFGAMLFEMLTGTKPFPGDDVSQMLARVIERDPDWSLLPPSTPARVVQAIAVCLRKDPRQRVGDLSAVRLALDGAFETPASPIASPSTAGKPREVGRWAVALASLAAAAIGGAVVWSFTRETPPAQTAVQRFVITTPPDRPPIAANTSVPEVALSPDGSLIAYGTASGQAAATLQIYVRSLGALEPTLLRGTEGGGTSPFFSPDGQSIGFIDVTDNTLRRVPVTGGTAQVVGKFPSTPVGMEWAPDNTILFTLAGNAGGALMRIPAAGGEATPVTKVDTAAGDRVHLSPDVLPGGAAAVFSITGQSGTRLAVVTLATGAITDLKVPGIDPSYSPTGHIVYTGGDGTLQAIGFDADRLAVTTNAPVQVAENVVTRPDVAQFALAGNGSLAYIAGTGATAQRTLVWVDRDGKKEPVGLPPRLYGTPRVSPDGTRAALAIDGDIWVTELARPGTLQRVTTDPARERFPLWSRDSQRIVFESNKGGTFSIVSKAADGRGEDTIILSELAKDATLLSPEAWSADSREVVFIYRVGTGSFDIGRVPMDGSQKWQPVLNTDAAESGVTMSPDGRRIAYEANDSGELEIYVEEFPRLGNRQIVSSGGGSNPVWSRDGRELYYRLGADDGGGIMISPIQTAPAFTLGMGRALFGGNYYQVTAGARQWDVAPDGRFLMQEGVNDEASRPQLILVLNWFDELRRLVPVN